jgi:hypothetical protein
MENLFPNNSANDDNDIQKNIRIDLETDYNNNEIDCNFTEHEITYCVNIQNNKKSPGEDGFTADIIKRWHSMDSSFLTTLYNKCLEFMIFPNKWKQSIIKIIRVMKSRLQAPELIQANQFTFCICKDIRKTDDK